MLVQYRHIVYAHVKHARAKVNGLYYLLNIYSHQCVGSCYWWASCYYRSESSNFWFRIHWQIWVRNLFCDHVNSFNIQLRSQVWCIIPCGTQKWRPFEQQICPCVSSLLTVLLEHPVYINIQILCRLIESMSQTLMNLIGNENPQIRVKMYMCSIHILSSKQ